MAWKVLIAPASFKGSLSALEAGEAIRRGFFRVAPAADLRVTPLADGGEGTVEVLRLALGGQARTTAVTGPLGLEAVQARWAILPDGVTAVIEMAQASGLPLVPPERRDPLVTTTAGTGELIREAVAAGCRNVLVGLGGSATVDGGLGALRALGVGLLDEQGRPVPPGGRGLLHLHRIDAGGLDPRLAGVNFTVLADVNNPLVGPDGAARVFGPQKGADPDTVEALDRGLANFAAVATRATSAHGATAVPNLATLPGGGAAGGLGAALVAFLGARLVSGIDHVMAATGLAAQIAWADLVVTGEGQLDGQSLRGKACSGVARLARAVGRPVVAVVGAVRGEDEAVFRLGLDAVLPLPPGPLSLVQAMDGAAEYLEAAGARLARLLLAGGRLGRG